MHKELKMAVGLTISRCPHIAVAGDTYHTNMGHRVPILECIFKNFHCVKCSRFLGCDDNRCLTCTGDRAIYPVLEKVKDFMLSITDQHYRTSIPAQAVTV